jgi:hypothetical protein
MRAQPPADEVRPYLELGLACAGDYESEALVWLLASQGYWEFGYGIDPADEGGERARAAARRAREVARRIGRPDLELTALDSLTSGFNVRGLYGLAEAIDLERVELARALRDPFEVSDSFYTAAWSALEVGRYRDVVELVTEYEAMDVGLASFGQLSLAVLARLPLGDWDEALADQARIRQQLGDNAARPPAFGSGGHGVEALIYELRGDHLAAAVVLAEIAEWRREGEWPRLWSTAPAAVALARRGEFASARQLLAQLPQIVGVYKPRELETRCTLIAEEGTWDEAPAVIADARRHAEAAQLLALPLHADRLEGRALLAAGDAEGALAPLERAASGFASLGAAWEVALTDLSRGEALAALGRDCDAAEALSQAAATFARLRVPREVDRTRALLNTLSPTH